MPDLVTVTYARTGESTKADASGMRPMQQRAWAARNAQYLLLKAPPSSGKSRALMYLALDKLANQGIRQVIVAVPERSIGGSFAPTALSTEGFFADWSPTDIYNLCTPGGDGRKVAAFKRFLEEGKEKILICTHATLRFAFEVLDVNLFSNTLLAIDEFHHASAGEESRLGELVRTIISGTNAHIIAMTGSYFRGDAVPVLLPADEALFTKVVYNYYEQLNGYKYLKSLGIGYHFYRGRYTDAIMEILDTNKKTILHIPNINSGESTKKKHEEVDFILDGIGDIVNQDSESGIISVRKRGDGKILKVADLVEDEPSKRDKVVNYLRNLRSADDLDLIIALGMAKEGFDWPWCEHALTIGYRGSLTEVVQIIGRATRDSDNKIHAQYTNLISQPDAHDEQVIIAVNNMLKAITASLLMEQVLAPIFKFKPKDGTDEGDDPGTIQVRGIKKITSKRVGQILETDLADLQAAILSDTVVKAGIGGNIDAEVINKVLIPKIIMTKYPDLSVDETEQLRQHTVASLVVNGGTIETQGNKQFLRMARQFVNIHDLDIDLIDRINPFQRAYEVLSKSVTAPVLRSIMDAIGSNRVTMTEEEAIVLWPKIRNFVTSNGGKEPDMNADDPLEGRLAEALILLRNLKRKQAVNG